MSWFKRKRTEGGGFKARSPERDRETDAARFERLRHALNEIVGDVDREHAGLSARLKVATEQASGLVGNDVYEYLDRDPESEAALRKAESQMANASARLRQLDRTRAKIAAISGFVDQELARD